MLLAALGLYPEAQTWIIVGVVSAWLIYAAYGMPYLLLGMNAKEVLFSLVRVVAMFVGFILCAGGRNGRIAELLLHAFADSCSLRRPAFV